ERGGIPAGVRAVLTRRLRGLSPPTRMVLETAAVIGAEFDVAVLAAVTGQSAVELLEALDEADSAQLVVGDAGRPRIAFVHALVQEVLYESLPSAERRRLHARIAEVLEQRHGESGVTEIAHHFVRAAVGEGDDRAVEWAVRAGEHCFSVLA